LEDKEESDDKNKEEDYLPPLPGFKITSSIKITYRGVMLDWSAFFIWEQKLCRRNGHIQE